MRPTKIVPDDSLLADQRLQREGSPNLWLQHGVRIEKSLARKQRHNKIGSLLKTCPETKHCRTTYLEPSQDSMIGRVRAVFSTAGGAVVIVVKSFASTFPEESKQGFLVGNHVNAIQTQNKFPARNSTATTDANVLCRAAQEVHVVGFTITDTLRSRNYCPNGIDFVLELLRRRLITESQPAWVACFLLLLRISIHGIHGANGLGLHNSTERQRRNATAWLACLGESVQNVWVPW